MKKTTFLTLSLLCIVALFSAFSVHSNSAADPEVTFETFLEQFPAQKLPYALDEKSLQARLDQAAAESQGKRKKNRETPKRLDWHYFKFLRDINNELAFSRMPLQVEPIARFTVGDHYAVLYSTSRSFRSNFATFHLSVLDKKGEQISSNQIGQIMPELLISSTISSELKAEITRWEIEWEENYEEKGLRGNAVKALSYVDTKSIDLLKATPKEPLNLKRELAPPVLLEDPIQPEAIKSK
jgi:hypothetical protein